MRAQAALQAGLEYAAARLAPRVNCNVVQDLPGLPANFTVTFTNCARRGYNGNTVFVYTFDEIAATSGVYGTPEYVRRSVRNIRITL
jgi:hypothetical protein